MWKKRELIAGGFSNYNLGSFVEGLPRVLDLIEDANKIPRLYTLAGKKEAYLDVLSPKDERDRLTVGNFKEGIIELVHSYLDHQVYQKDFLKENFKVSVFPKDLGDITRENFGNLFLSIYVSFGETCYGLEFMIKNNVNYFVNASKDIPDFCKIMDRFLGPNVRE